MKKIEYIPVIDAGDFPNQVEDEFEDNEVSTHYQSDIICLDWAEDEGFPQFKKWLMEEYGESIQSYEEFAIRAA